MKNNLYCTLYLAFNEGNSEAPTASPQNKALKWITGGFDGVETTGGAEEDGVVAAAGVGLAGGGGYV